jgi:hypothetical protein
MTSPTLTTAAQMEAILRVLEAKGRMTTLDARSKGIMHPAMRVCELRKKGFDIVTHWQQQTDNAGVTHRVGVYVLEGVQT